MWQKLNPFAMTHPQTEEDVLAIFQEIHAELAIVRNHFEAAWQRCEADCAP